MSGPEFSPQTPPTPPTNPEGFPTPPGGNVEGMKNPEVVEKAPKQEPNAEEIAEKAKQKEKKEAEVKKQIQDVKSDLLKIYEEEEKGSSETPVPQIPEIKRNSYDISRNFERSLGKIDLKKLIIAIHENSENNPLRGRNIENGVFSSEEILTLQNEMKDVIQTIKVNIKGEVSKFYELFIQELNSRMEQVQSDTYHITEWKQNIKIYENEEKKQEGDPKVSNVRNIVAEGNLKVGINE